MTPTRNSQKWLAIRVELVSGAHHHGGPPPGRDLLVGPQHTFADLADGINTAFARWDLSRLHEFQLADGSRIGLPEGEWEEDELADESKVLVSSRLQAGETFTYVFDFGDDWTHDCRVLSDDVDPVEAYGVPPEGIVPIWGWGLIPDQYGRDGSEE